MGLFSDWLNSKRAKLQATALREQAEVKRHARRIELQEKQDKSPRDLAELNLLESNNVIGIDWLRAWRDISDRMLDFSRGGMAVGGGITSHLRRDKSDFPFFRSEAELGIIRDASRILCGDDPYAIGLLNGLESYTIGDGATVRVEAKNEHGKTLAEMAQRVVDKFCQRNKFQFKQKEFFKRSRRDGEAYWRLFANDGECNLRFVWPEQIKQPPNADPAEWQYGRRSEIGDAEVTIEWSVFPADGVDLQPEYVPADEIVFIHLNVDTGVARGLPDFAGGTGDTLRDADKLADNMGIGSALQAAIAYIRQHDGAPAETVRAFAGTDASYTKTDVFTGRIKNVRNMDPGTIVDTNQNTTFIPSPYSGAATSHLEVGKMLLRRACVRWNAPEWLGSSDASNNNYASSLTAESPFVLAIKASQALYADCFRDLFERVLKIASLSGKLPGIDTKDLFEAIEIKVTLPTPIARNRLEDAQRNAIEIQAGYQSPQQAAEECGREFDRVKKDRELLGMTFGEQPTKMGDLNVTKGKVQTPAAKEPATESLQESKDASGHDHKGKGPGGGQFTGGGEGGNGSSDDGKKKDNPIRVYHGTSQNFTQFDTDEKAGSNIDAGFLGKGSYFTTSTKTAEYYAKSGAGRNPGATKMVHHVDLNLKNPFDWGAKNLGARGEVYGNATIPDSIRDAVYKRVGFAPAGPDDEPDFAKEIVLAKAIRDELMARGHDGVVSSLPDGHKEYVAFDSDTIKIKHTDHID